MLNNLGNVLLDMDEGATARNHLEEAVSIHRELGDRWAIGNALNNLGNVTRSQGDYAVAKELYEESLTIYRDLGDRWALAYLFEDVAWLSALCGSGRRALRLVAAGAVLREQINAPMTPIEQQKLRAALEPALEAFSEEEQNTEMTKGREMDLFEAILFALER